MVDWNKYFAYQSDGTLWRLDRPQKSVGSPINAKGYLGFKFEGNRYRVHRVVWEMHNGEIPEGLYVDHIDRDSTNNRIENLRLVTVQQNNRNQQRKGYSYDKARDAYRARIWVDGKSIELGSYAHEEDASNAYQTAKQNLFGEHAPVGGGTTL